MGGAKSNHLSSVPPRVLAGANEKEQHGLSPWTLIGRKRLSLASYRQAGSFSVIQIRSPVEE